MAFHRYSYLPLPEIISWNRFLVVCLFALFYSCGPKCKGDKNEIFIVQIDSVTLSNFDNSGKEPVLTGSPGNPDTVPAKAFGIGIGIFSDKYSSGWLDTKCGKLRYDSRVSAVDIITLNDFDSDHPTGKSVSELFRMENRAQKNARQVNSFFLNNPYEGGARIYLFKSPASEGIFRFLVTLVLENGVQLSDTSKPVKLTL